MARRPRELCDSGTYHVMMRGINKQIVFIEEEDYTRFLQTVARFCRKYRVEVYAYCLMSNHVHLLLRQGDEELWQTLRRISVSYLMWYNKKYERIGPLFQGRFTSKAIADDRQLLATTRYIHCNPLKAKLSDSLSYKWSSYDCYLGAAGIVDTSFLKSMIDEREYIRLHNSDDAAVELLDEMRCKDDAKVIDFLVRAAGVSNIHDVSKLPVIKRGELIQKARRKRVTMHQLSHLTGISRPTLYRCLKMYEERNSDTF